MHKLIYCLRSATPCSSSLSVCSIAMMMKLPPAGQKEQACFLFLIAPNAAKALDAS